MHVSNVLTEIENRSVRDYYFSAVASIVIIIHNDRSCWSCCCYSKGVRKVMPYSVYIFCRLTPAFNACFRRKIPKRFLQIQWTTSFSDYKNLASEKSIKNDIISMSFMPLIRPLIYARYPASHGVATRAIRNISTRNRRNKTKIQNQWLHTNYDRKRHADVNRSTGGIFFVISTVAAGVSIYVMGKA
jgi:hypothetical protein